ncbi:ECF transporter S component [Bacillus salipaludis]|uniref:ECF transporter S component n=1 Tax=Bacillus salipaludis TaxID=2547811 RepID=A0A4R5VKH0_9BACI|nr:ECF transporter S component [Bacillus salipaludis]MDQ6596241.1 ECF transporter S component [Bacillus salipaludis]TDK58441.1 ECF transporter S component [Bacillus salipaludis]
MNSTFVQTESTKTKAIVINALFIAMTFVATMFINIRLPLMGNGGLIHLGNVPLFLAALVYGKKTGAIAGAFGMGLFDIVSGWAIWSPFTFVIVGAMGFVVGLISEKSTGNRVLASTLAIAVALIIKVVGYYFAEVILYGNWVQPFGSVPGNIMQVVLAGIIVIPIAARLKKRA